ncbi:MAG: hypothetical protein AB7N76_27070 [Planctomycetota bacterium]
MKLRLDDEDELRRGWPGSVELRLENTGEDAVLLEVARWRAPASGEHRWRHAPLGLIHYDAQADRYQHHTAASARAAVSLWSGLLHPGGRAGALVPARCLLAGEQELTLEVSCYELPLSALPARIYCADAAALSAPVTGYEPWGPERPRATDVVARIAGLSRQTHSVSAKLRVLEDEAAPAAAAEAAVRARGAEGAALLGRVRRLGGAWALLASDGALWLSRGEELLRCPPGTADRALLEVLDQGSPHEPVPVLFHGPPAESLRASGLVPLEGDPDRSQRQLTAEGLWALLAALPGAGVRLAWERHASIQEGLVVR